MINTYILTGRLTRDFELQEKDNKKFANNTLAVSRLYKNSNGEYDTDFFNFTIFDNNLENYIDRYKKGDLIGLKGTLTTYDNKICLNVDRMTLITSKSKKDEIEQEKKLDM